MYIKNKYQVTGVQHYEDIQVLYFDRKLVTSQGSISQLSLGRQVLNMNGVNILRNM